MPTPCLTHFHFMMIMCFCSSRLNKDKELREWDIVMRIQIRISERSCKHKRPEVADKKTKIEHFLSIVQSLGFRKEGEYPEMGFNSLPSLFSSFKFLCCFFSLRVENAIKKNSCSSFLSFMEVRNWGRGFRWNTDRTYKELDLSVSPPSSTNRDSE